MCALWLTLGGTYVRLVSVSETAVFCGFVVIVAGGDAYIKTQTTLTYRGDKTRPLSHTYKKIPSEKNLSSEVLHTNKNSILEFLQSCACRMDDKISETFFCLFRILYCAYI